MHLRQRLQRRGERAGGRVLYRLYRGITLVWKEVVVGPGCESDILNSTYLIYLMLLVKVVTSLNNGKDS